MGLERGPASRCSYHVCVVTGGKRESRLCVSWSLKKNFVCGMIGVIQVLEVVSEAGRCVRCEDVEGVRQFVNAAQQHAMLLHHLKR